MSLISGLVCGFGGPCDYSVSPSPFNLDFGTLDFGTSDSGLTIRLGTTATVHCSTIAFNVPLLQTSREAVSNGPQASGQV